MPRTEVLGTRCQMNVCLRRLFKIIIPSLVFVSWILVIIQMGGCGDLDTEIASLTVSPANPTIGINKSQVFSVTAKNSAGYIISVTPVWSADSAIGTISSTGLFTAGNVAGQGTVTATVSPLTATANVTVTENGWIEGTLNSDLGAAVNVKVYLNEASTLWDRSDSSGKYSIDNVPPGTYRVITEPTATYQSGSQEVTVARGQTVTGTNFFLPLQPGIPTVPTTTIPTF